MHRWTFAVTAISLALVGRNLWAEPAPVAESLTDLRVFQVETKVTTRGNLVTLDGPGKTRELPIDAQGRFVFRERRLPSAGRDALAHRAIREFQTAHVQATVDGAQSSLQLPPESALIVTSGRLDGLQSYSLRTLLTRDQVDLLDIPADPLALAAALPGVPLDAGAEWNVPDWAAQLLAGVEAVESAQVTGEVVSVADDAVRLQLSGSVQGLQEGAKTTVQLEGELDFNLASAYLSGARLQYTIKADVGSVAPGVDAVVQVTMTRSPSTAGGGITDAVVASIPLEAPPQALRLVFNAAPWSARLRHGRRWYVFQVVLDEPPRVAILRLVEQGSLVCQCNISPIPDAAPGQHTPMEQYEQDIRTVLGNSLKSIKSQQVSALPDGRTLLEVIALGEVQVSGKDKEGNSAALAIPMEWRYYILADRSGRQMSFVFAVEQALAEQLGGRDRDLVESLEFLAGG